MTLEEVKSCLRDAPNNFNSRNSEPIRQTLADLKEKAIKENNQFLAKTLWCFEEILDIQDNFITAYFQMKKEEFYGSWCSLERVELGLQFLGPHLQDTDDEFHTRFIEKHVFQFQSLFPYKLFMSPEMLEIKKECSICHKVISPRDPCGHRVGEIYDGKLCTREVTEGKVLAIAFVREPVQKYSVPFLFDATGGAKKDHYNYAAVRYLIRRLSSPFHAWEVIWTKRRHPHSRYTHVGRNDACPCDSGKKYKDCCLLKSGVLRPHLEFVFHVLPPKRLLTVEYSD
jgi:hypothetical protein